MFKTLQFAFKAVVGNLQGVKPMFGFNVSERCPIGCDCYWRRQLAERLNLSSAQETKALPILGRKLEMSDDQVVQFFKQKEKEGSLMVLIIGGEPYVRPELLAKLGGIIPWTGVVTSGTSPLIKMERTYHLISIDGKDAETHDRIRQSRGLFDRIVSNVKRARTTHQKFPLAIHTVLNRENFLQTEEIVRFWKDNGLADWIVFSGHTPIAGAGDEHLHLCDSDSYEAVHELHRLKDKYPGFVNMTHQMISTLQPHRMMFQNPENCPTAQFTDAYYANGQKIERCIFGPDGDCSRCGCIVTIGFEPLKGVPTFDDLRVAWRLRP